MIEWIPIFIMIALGSFMISAAVAYHHWRKVRVVFLREEIFAIRDDLWDRMRELHAFEDPAYKAARRSFNSCIRMASYFSMPALQVLRETEAPDIEKSKCEEVQEAIDNANAKVSRAIWRHVMFRTFTGRKILLDIAAQREVEADAKEQDVQEKQSRLRRWVQTTGPALAASIVCKTV